MVYIALSPRAPLQYLTTHLYNPYILRPTYCTPTRPSLVHPADFFTAAWLYHRIHWTPSPTPCSQPLLCLLSPRCGLVREIKAGSIAGLFETPPFSNLRCSGLGLVPKGESGWRLIFHLSAPTGSSTFQHYYSLQYHTIDDATSILANL